MNKQYSNISVLIFWASGRQAIPVIKGFYDIGAKVAVYCKSKLEPGYLTRYTSNRIVYNEKNQYSEKFYEYGARIIREGRFDIVIPLRDKAAIFLSQHKEELQKYAKIAVNDWDVIQYATDKSRTMSVCEKLGIPAPITVTGDQILKQIEEKNISFPVVVKPCTQGGSIGFNIFKDQEKLSEYLLKYDGRFGKLLVQEYIEQGNAPQYRADFFRDREGNFKAAIAGKVTRWYPLDGGFGIFGITIHDDQIIEMGKKLLDEINWNGYANIDMVWDDKQSLAKILEINPRTGASIALDYEAGINMSRLILENELGLPVTDFMEYEDNKKISCFFVDLLWFIKSKDRFNTKPSWFDRRGIKDVIFSWRDPLPAAGYLIESIMNLRKTTKKRTREQ